MDFIQKGVDDVVFLSIVYPQKIIANIHVSWLDPQKVRKMIVVGSRKMVVYDDVADDKIAIYDKGIDKKAILGQNMDFDHPRPEQFSYRSGDILLPQDSASPSHCGQKRNILWIVSGTAKSRSPVCRTQGTWSPYSSKQKGVRNFVCGTHNQSTDDSDGEHTST